MRLLQSYENKRSYRKGGTPIGISPYPARLKDFPRASATMRSRMPGDRCVAEDLGVPRAGKPNLRALPRPAQVDPSRKG